MWSRPVVWDCRQGWNQSLGLLLQGPLPRHPLFLEHRSLVASRPSARHSLSTVACMTPRGSLMPALSTGVVFTLEKLPAFSHCSSSSPPAQASPPTPRHT